MLYRIVGSGIFALILFLYLFVPGTSGKASQPSLEIYGQASAAEESLIEESLVTLAREGVLQTRTELSESLQAVRRFPVAASLLFLLTRQNEAAVVDQSRFLCLSFSPPKDLLTAYRVLRI